MDNVKSSVQESKIINFNQNYEEVGEELLEVQEPFQAP